MTTTAHTTGTPLGADSDRLTVDTIRFLAADMVQAANSGHPGLPMGAAPMAWALFSRHLRHNPTGPTWADRDRFILPAGHCSALQYALLHMFGYDLDVTELRNFRQLGSATPGYPEFGHTAGVETTTGPLGQGLATGVGMALAERMQAARYPDVTDHHTYVIVGDGFLMDGVSHEAASLAGHLRLGRLIVLFDDNDITIDGAAQVSCGDDQLARFAAYGWQVARVGDGTDVAEIDAAKAQADWDEQPFTVPDAVREVCTRLTTTGVHARAEWRTRFADFAQTQPERAAQWSRSQDRQLPDGTDELFDNLPTGAAKATRQSSQTALTAVSALMPELVGGSADLAGSTGTVTDQQPVTAQDYSGPVIRFGIREFAMAAVLNGLSLHGGFRAYGSTFLVFSDYLRPALRLSALMRQPVIYILSHDSVAVGEDGPTHQPVEHVESLRLIPGVRVLRPADDHETIAAWRAALAHTSGPTVLVLSRQSLPSLESVPGTPVDSLTVDGARVVSDVEAPAVDLTATGSEVAVAVATAKLLRESGLAVRVISAPWREQFTRRRETFGRAPLAISVEAGSTQGWLGIAYAGAIGIDTFGVSGSGDAVLAHFGLTPEAVAERVLQAVAQQRSNSTNPSERGL